MDRLRVLRAATSSAQLRLLVGGFLGFTVAEAAAWVAILVYAQQRGGAAETGVAALTQLLPPALIAPFAGAVSDRHSRQRVLVAASALQALALAATAFAMAADASGVVVYLTGAVATSAMSFHRPIVWALLPWVVSRPDHLTAANVAGSFSEGVGLLIGPMLAALLLVSSGPGAVFLVMSAVMAVVAVASSRLEVHRGEGLSDTPSAANVISDLRHGMRSLVSGGMAPVVLMLGGGFVLLGAVDVAGVILAVEVLGRGEAMAGLLSAAVGIGAVLGSSASIVVVGRAKLLGPLVIGAALAGGAVMIAGSSTAVALTLLLFVLNGVGAQVLDVVGKTIVQRSTTDDVLARVFSIVESLTIGSMAAGALAFGWLSSVFEPSTAALILGGLPLVVLLAALPGLRRVDAATEPPDLKRIDALLGVPMFEPLATPVIEQLALNMVEGTFDEGEIVILEGTHGSLFFVIESGELEVVQQGEVRAVYTTGDYVGEVALLRNQVRNATVRARTMARVWSIDRVVFLEAVTGHPQSRDRGESIARDRDG